MSTPLTIGIIGARCRNDTADFIAVEKVFVRYWIDQFAYRVSIVSGGCPRGGDRFAKVIAAKYNVPIKNHHPEWKKHGKPAAFIRNGLIAQDADVLIACVAPGYQPKDEGGTPDTIRKFLAAHPEGKVILV